MKTMVQIFAVYMFALSFVPCGDGGNGLSEILSHQQEVVASATPDHHHSNDCGDDDCSPFCICNCCSMVLHPTVKQTLATLLPPFIFSESPFAGENVLSGAFHQAIWQPPKV